MKRIRRILHASDLSSASARAFKQAVEMAKAGRAELILAHVMTPVVPLVGDGYVPAGTWAGLEERVRKASQARLDTLARRARRTGIRARTLLLEGIPASSIIRAARAKHANLIVMGTHGREGLAKLFIGSVAERVVAGARCPVLTVRSR